MSTAISPSQVIVALTNAVQNFANGEIYDYTAEDKVMRNMLTGEVEVWVAGQNKGIHDHRLLSGIEAGAMTSVYCRPNKSEPFRFVGKTTEVVVVQERTVAINTNSLATERLRIHLIIDATNAANEVINTEYLGRGKFKRAVLDHAGFPADKKKNINHGFYVF